MKKALSLILAIMMIFALSTTAFAAKTDIVGTLNGTNGTKYEDYRDGNTSLVGTNPSTNIAITATTSAINHRYAVDIDYEPMSFNISGGNMEWDVKNLKYIVKNGDPAKNTGFLLVVTNYSDMPVSMTASLATQTTDNDLFTSSKLNLDIYEGTFTEADGVAIAPKVEGVEKVITGEAQTIKKAEVGQATSYPFSLLVTSDDWIGVANDYVDYFSRNSVERVNIATLTVTIAA